jgi:hypothetical protein
MKLLAVLAVGYVLGARTAGDDLDDVWQSLRAIRDSEEFHDLLTSARSHASHTLRELAAMVDRDPLGSDSDSELALTHDLVERVRHLAGLR